MPGPLKINLRITHWVILAMFLIYLDGIKVFEENGAALSCINGIFNVFVSEELTSEILVLIKRFEYICLRIFFPWPPHIWCFIDHLHFFRWILRKNASLIQIYHKVFAKGPLQYWVIYEYFMIARIDITSIQVPIFCILIFLPIGHIDVFHVYQFIFLAFIF